MSEIWTAEMHDDSTPGGIASVEVRESSFQNYHRIYISVACATFESGDKAREFAQMILDAADVLAASKRPAGREEEA